MNAAAAPFDPVHALAVELDILKQRFATYREFDASARMDRIERALGQLIHRHNHVVAVANGLVGRVMALEAVVQPPTMLPPPMFFDDDDGPGIVDLYAEAEELP